LDDEVPRQTKPVAARVWNIDSVAFEPGGLDYLPQVVLALRREKVTRPPNARVDLVVRCCVGFKTKQDVAAHFVRARNLGNLGLVHVVEAHGDELGEFFLLSGVEA
jgi:hypothetical protein